VKMLNIVGAGSFGREIFSWMNTCEYVKKFDEVRFIDDNLNSFNSFEYLPKIHCTIKDFFPEKDETCVLSIANPRKKREVVNLLKSRGASFSSFIHPSVIVGSNTIIGEGVVLCPNVVVSCDVTIRDFVFLNIGAVIGHDAYLGCYTTLSPNSVIMGFATLGEGVFIGSNAAVLPKVLIEDFATVGVSTAALRKVESGKTILGVPGKLIG
jgi:sugar O-acyltransferase (sialic acid O-acetyltransferase NeuD family)